MIPQSWSCIGVRSILLFVSQIYDKRKYDFIFLYPLMDETHIQAIIVNFS